jgi:N-acetylglucosamine-6-phosphate deacetylase
LTAHSEAKLEGSIFTPRGWIEGRVDVAGGAVAAVKGRAVPEGKKPSGPFILPGFIDLHVHGGGGADWQGGEDGIRGLVRYHASHGTTAIAPTTATGPVSTIETSLSAIAAVKAKRRPGEGVVLGAHLEGPFVNPKKPGAMDVSLMLEGDPALAESWANRCRLVVATVAPEIPRGLEVIEALSARGCRVQIGHSIAEPAMVDKAFRCGCCGFTHLFNAMSGVEHRNPGVAAYALANARFAEMIGDLIHVDRTVVMAAYRAIPRLYAITDASGAAGLPDGTYQWGGRRAIKRGQKITLENGTTLAGSAITMLDAFRNLVAIGLTLDEAAEMTSVRQAEYLGLADLGRIEPGARACLVKLGRALDLQGVWVDGESVDPASQAQEEVALS